MAWIGKVIVAIGIVHTLFGLVAFRSTLGILWNEGLVSTVNGQPEREFAFWFIAFGILSMIFGAFVDWCEKINVPFPRFLGWSLLVFTAVVVMIMPISGGWLMVIPAMGAIRRSGAANQRQEKTIL